jgi:putative ABC transport system substrate-binding protein
LNERLLRYEKVPGDTVRAAAGGRRIRYNRSRVMPSRRSVLGVLSGLVAFGPGHALARRTTAPARIGWLSYIGQPDPGLENLRDGLRELGYAEGRSFVIIPRFADGDFTRLPRLVDELAGERLDVLVSRGPSVDYTRAVRVRVPVVFAYSGDPVAAGFADSLGKPGRSMTGITFMALELSAKRVEVLKELVPGAARIALLSNPEHAGELAEYRVTEDAARRLGAAITRYLVRSPQELSAVFADIRAARPDAMIVFPDSLTLVRRKEIVDFAARERIPSMYGWTEFAEAGGLVSYGARLTENFKTLAKFVDRLLKGASASAVPIEQVSRIALTLNLGAARHAGITVPPPVLLRAGRVID